MVLIEDKRMFVYYKCYIIIELTFLKELKECIKRVSYLSLLVFLKL